MPVQRSYQLLNSSVEGASYVIIVRASEFAHQSGAVCDIYFAVVESHFDKLTKSRLGDTYVK